MKRPRSYGENLDEAIPGEKGVFKDWGRRDPETDRPASHRRFYAKAEIGGPAGRKGSSSSSYDRPLDEDREPLSRSLSRKRFDHEAEGFDRRKFGGGGGGGFERYREEEDRSGQASSPRVSYGVGDRIYRSERFSLPSRRDYPKGFRSERERPRREGSSGSSWRRSSVGKEAADEEVKAPAASGDPVAGGGHRLPSEDRGKTKPKESSGGDQPVIAEVKKKKTQETRTENCSGSEMEEGELEPDPEPEPKPKPEPEPEPVVDVKSIPASEDSKETEAECRDGSAESSESGRKSSNEGKLASEEEDASGGKEEGVVRAPDLGKGTDEVPCHEVDSVKQVEKNDKRKEQEYENATTAATEDDKRPQVSLEVENVDLESPGHKQEGPMREQSAEEEVKDVPLLGKRSEKKEQMEKGVDLKSEVEAEHKEERCIDLEMEPKEVKAVDLETEAEVPMALFSSGNKAMEVNNNTELTLKLMTGNNDKDKGKSLAVSLSNEANSVDEEDVMEGPSSRGFELVFQSDITRLEKGSYGGIVIGKQKETKRSLEPLDLSLSLPGISLGHSSQDPKTRPNLLSASQDPRPRPTSPVPRSIQSLPSSFYTNSDGFTASISFSGSQPFVHNPSCSLTQNSMENYEQSVGSRPIFQGIDQATSGTIWQGQPSNESKCKGSNVPLYQRSILNGKLAQHSPHVVNGLAQQTSLPRQPSPTNSHGSRDTRSEHSKKVLKRERSSASLFRSEQQEGERIAFNGSGVIERVLTKIVSEPLQIVSRMIQDMTEQSVAYLRESTSEMVINRDKHAHLCALQEILQKRSDITLETLSKCHRALLEILVTLKTGLPDFLRRANNIPQSDLGEIFLNLKCRNLACRNILPVDECDCKVCVQKNGFCSACMCLVCSKFDLASNTCSWVGCDVCLHWCHTDCALRDSHIRNGSSVAGTQGSTEMQFHCVACGHPSEMFGFVKEVFKTCAKDWKLEVLAKELEYVRRIFSASEDSRGKQLCDAADQLLMKLGNKVSHSEVTRHILVFLAESDSNFSNGPSSVPQKDSCEKNTELTNGLVGVGSSKEAMCLPDASIEKSPRLENGTSIPPSLDMGHRRTGDVELQRSLEKQQVVDELDSVVKFKQAEAKMYQTRADDARKEAEGLKRIAVAKRERIEEEYANCIAKLRLLEAEEKRKQKFEELQALERAHHEYFNMKIRMEADIKNLLFKMEATKRNFNT